jgi:hypothetical protein
MEKKFILPDTTDEMENIVVPRGTCTTLNDLHFEVIKKGVRKLRDKIDPDMLKTAAGTISLKMNEYRCDNDVRVYYFTKKGVMLGDMGFLVILTVFIDDDNDDNSHVEITHGLISKEKILQYNKEFAILNKLKVSPN